MGNRERLGIIKRSIIELEGSVKKSIIKGEDSSLDPSLTQSPSLYVRFLNFLTLIEQGSWMLLESGGGAESAHTF